MHWRNTATAYGLLSIGMHWLVASIPEQEDVAGAVHFYLAWGLVILAGLHGLAALKHHFIDRDTTLLRMLGRAQPTSQAHKEL